MKKLSSTTLYIFILFFATKSLAQPIGDDTLVPDAVMAAPNAAALGKYADIPVSYNTGVPSISIPIYEVQEGPLRLPIGLSYHASGIKVGEPASWVGLGWALSAGGIITRTVMGGVPDEYSAGYFASQPTQYPPTDSIPMEVKQIIDGEKDSEPDIFSFNFAGYSGKFYIDSAAVNVYTVPKQDLAISFVDSSGNGLESFTIVTPNGVRYIFDKRESTQTSPNPLYTINEYVSSWYLTKIESADLKHYITLSYTSESYKYSSLASCQYARTRSYFDASYANTATNLPCNGQAHPMDPTNLFVNYQEIQGWRLTKITSSTSTIDFYATVNRTDLEEIGDNPVLFPKRLDRIEITSGTFCKKWVFNHDYFLDPSKSSYAEAKRLKLESLQEIACNGLDTIPPYTFDYLGEINPDSSTYLPHRLSKDIDHWGFSNKLKAGSGNQDNLMNVPAVVVPTECATTFPPASLPPLVTSANSNRGPNADAMEAGTLEAIHYPTKGAVFFTYEPHEAYAPEDFSSQETFATLIAQFDTSLHCYSASPDPLCCIYVPDPAGTDDLTQNLTADQLANGGFELQLQPRQVFGCTPPHDNPNEDFTIIFKIYNSSGSVLDSVSLNTTPNIGTVYYEKMFDEIPGMTTPGNYKFEIERFGKAWALLTLYNTNTTTSENRMVGGLRIKEIRRSTDNIPSDDDIIRTFEYKKKDTPSQSSGYLVSGLPKYIDCLPFYPAFRKVLSGYESIRVDMLIVKDYSITPLSTMDGKHMTYRHVKEYFGPPEDKARNGWIEHTYNIEYQDSSIQYTYYRPPVARIGDGLRNKKTVFEQGGNIIQQDSIGYQTFQYETFGYIVYNAIRLPAAHSIDEIVAPYYTEYFPQTAARLVDYTQTIIDGVETENTLMYDTPNLRHLNPIRTTITNSDGKVTITNMDYAHEMKVAGNNVPVWQALIDHNIIGIPIQTTTEVGGTQVDGSLMEYRFFDGSTGGSPSTTDNGTLPYPHEFKRYEMSWDAGGLPTGETWNTVGTVNSIDTASGFPASVTMRGWEPETYIWNDTSHLLKKRTFKDFEWEYEYHTGTTLVKKITDIDGQYATYEYDALMRLKKTSARLDSVATEYFYQFKDGSNPHNYVRTNSTYSKVDSSDLVNRNTYQYLDGLGRPIQTVEQAYNDGDFKDIVTATVYDNQGRPYKQYDPFKSSNSNGSFVSTIPGTADSTITTYEASPLNRAASVTPPDWYATTMAYGNNSSSMTIAGVSYAANTLMTATVTDPNGNETIEFKDRKGRMVLMRRDSVNSSKNSDTEFLYDDKDRVSTVEQPDAPNTAYHFRYLYDERDRVLEKKTPGRPALVYKYNERDLPTFVQDGNMNNQDKWLLTKYDDYGRATGTGFYDGDPADGNDATKNFTEQLTENSYDGTLAIELGKVKTSKAKILGTDNDWLQTSFTYDTHGRILQSASNHHLYLTDLQSDVVTYTYDFADNVTKEVREHKKDAGASLLTIQQEMRYDSVGRVKAKYHKINDGTKVQLCELSYTPKDQISERNIGKVGTSFLQSLDYTYLPNGFLHRVNQPSLGGGALTMPTCSDTLPNPTASSTLDDNDLFYFELRYDSTDTNIGAENQKNGNIGQIVWRTRGRERQSYGFKYDFLSRLSTATFDEITEAGSLRSRNWYSTSYQYDARGNITDLTRNGVYWDGSCWQNGEIDDLSFTHDTRMRFITDSAPGASKDYGFKPGAGGEYQYDFNGNIILDPHKDMDVVYNYLNLPEWIEFEDCKTIEFTYDANGTKLRKELKNGTMLLSTHDYLGSIEYKGGELEAIYHEEGRVYYEGGTGRYEYSIRDHLGNTRLTFTDKDGDGEIEISDDVEISELLQENHYYPFGMAMDGQWMANTGREDKYQYNGKELNDDFGLNWYDYGARWYMPDIGRWGQVDPMANDTSNVSWSPFAAMWNNPLNVIDPTGAFNEYVGKIDDEGNITYEYVSDKGGDEVDYITYVDSDGDEIGSGTLDVEITYTPGTGRNPITDPTPGQREFHGKTPTIFTALLTLFTGGGGTASKTLGFAAKANKTQKRIPKGQTFWDTVNKRVAKGGEFMREKTDGYLRLFKKGEKADKTPNTTTTTQPSDIDRSMEEFLKNAGRFMKHHMKDGPGGG